MLNGRCLSSDSRACVWIAGVARKCAGGSCLNYDNIGDHDVIGHASVAKPSPRLRDLIAYPLSTPSQVVLEDVVRGAEWTNLPFSVTVVSVLSTNLCVSSYDSRSLAHSLALSVSRSRHACRAHAIQPYSVAGGVVSSSTK